MPPNGPALLVEGLRKHYGDVKAVDGLDLSVAGGECFGLLGPNGAGKTTTIEICEGLLAPDAGRVELLGLRWTSNEHELRERLGIQLQETQLADKLTVEETVRMFRSFYRAGRPVDEAISLVQLDEKRDARVGKLSGGQKQRLALACAIEEGCSATRDGSARNERVQGPNRPGDPPSRARRAHAAGLRARRVRCHGVSAHLGGHGLHQDRA